MVVELIEFLPPNDFKHLGKLIKSRRDPGGYTIHPVEARAFERWSKTVSDQKLNVQYTDRSLTWQVMLKQHDGVAGVAVDHLIKTPQELRCDASLWVEYSTTMSKWQWPLKLRMEEMEISEQSYLSYGGSIGTNGHPIDQLTTPKSKL